MTGRKSRDVTYATVYFRLLLLTGITWMFGFLNEYFKSDVLDYCFIVLIGGQGIFLFAAFHAGRLFSKLKRICVYKQDFDETLETTTTQTETRNIISKTQSQNVDTNLNVSH
jgi:hypothetical protein